MNTKPDFSETNPISKMLKEYDAQRAKKPRKPPYKKPESIKQLENQIYEQKKLKHEAALKPSLRDDSANGLTKCVVNWLIVNNHYGARVNVSGIYDKRLGRYRHSGATKGQADINAVINGRSIQIEVKHGKDKPRPEQLKTQIQVNAAGGFYLFVRSFDDFLTQINNQLINNH